MLQNKTKTKNWRQLARGRRVSLASRRVLADLAKYGEAGAGGRIRGTLYSLDCFLRSIRGDSNGVFQQVGVRGTNPCVLVLLLKPLFNSKLHSLKKAACDAAKEKIYEELGISKSDAQPQSGQMSREDYEANKPDELRKDVRMLSGCADHQTSADVSSIAKFQLPDPAGAGKRNQ